MAQQQVNAEATLGNPSALISLYELDARYISAAGQQFFFHPGVNGLLQPVTYNGITYTPYPVEITQMEMPGNGSLPRPKVRAANINGFLSQFLLTEGDLVGAKFIRRRVYARFLDNSNFPNNVNPFGTPDPTAAYDDEIFYINRKVTENQELVEFECVTPLELDNVQIPYRKVLGTVCPFRFRDAETCGYTSFNAVCDRFGKTFSGAGTSGYGFTGMVYTGAWNSGVNYGSGTVVSIVSQNDFTYGQTFVYVCRVDNTSGISNNPQFNTTNWIPDACPHNLLGCGLHYPNGQLPAGFFPAVARLAYES